MAPYPQIVGDGGGDWTIITTCFPDDEPEDVKAIGDRIASLTLVQAVELRTYLKQAYGVEIKGLILG